MYILIVQNSREISDRVAKELDVKHETPQIMIISDGKAVYHVSHGDIDPDEVATELIEAR
jgi:bacillithiol system protein YtxJ